MTIIVENTQEVLEEFYWDYYHPSEMCKFGEEDFVDFYTRLLDRGSQYKYIRFYFRDRITFDAYTKNEHPDIPTEYYGNVPKLQIWI